MLSARILITGASGMVGRNVCEHFASERYDLLVPSSRELDLLDKGAVRSYFASHKPDMVIHCAGKVGGIQANVREPVRFLMDNLEMGRNVIFSAREYGVYKVLNLGSSCMYPREGVNPLKEDTFLKGELEPTNEGYAIAKITIAKLCEYIGHEDPAFKYRTIIPCNLYGRYDKFNPKNSHMVPAIIHKLHEAKMSDAQSVGIWGDGTARREFMCASDLADCIWRAVEYFDSLPQNMNVGLGEDWSVNEYYRFVADVVGYKGLFSHDLSKPVGMKQKLVDSTLLNQWGWQPKLSLLAGLTATYEFYLQEARSNESI